MDRMTPSQIAFIEAQSFFFVATAAAEGRVNVSPKGLDTLRVLDERRLAWLNLSGSGNETAAHVAANGRMTVMFMSIADRPLILRVYGTARVVHPRDQEWEGRIGLFPTMGGARQLFELSVESTASSCGSGVPVMTITADRGETELEPHYAAMSEEELHGYWGQKNIESIDGLPTHIFDG